MKFGVLSDVFIGAGAKFLTPNELKKQHEFQGVRDFRALLGEPADKKKYDTRFYWFPDDEDEEPLVVSSYCTWSDVRRGNPGRPAEYHLYYAAEANELVRRACGGDLLVIALTRLGDLIVVLCPGGSTVAQQILWLFGLMPETSHADVKTLGKDHGVTLGFSARTVLETLGVEKEQPEPDAFDELIDRFGLNFPGTSEFSRFARSTCRNVDPVAAPDEALMAWMDHEEALFRHLEKQIVAERLQSGFLVSDEPDVDGFIAYSLSVQNRRKSRAGWAFGHHVAAVLDLHKVGYVREATTEKRNGPDFLFPDEAAYHDETFDGSLLSMLAVKTSCKDRWRQVLAEANRISEKHLLTLQPAISLSQTAEMQAERLQLVVPREILGSYAVDQQAWLLDFEAFLQLVKGRQDRM